MRPPRAAPHLDREPQLIYEWLPQLCAAQQHCLQCSLQPRRDCKGAGGQAV